eukprot:symbB.v1.2.008503.t1/scaffold527.1/size293072/1
MASPKCWSVKDVADWLRGCGFESLTNLFEKEGVDGEVLLSLTLDELKEEFQMKLGERKKLMERIRVLQEAQEVPSSVSTGDVMSGEPSRQG